MTTMFKDEAARATILAAFDRFRADGPPGEGRTVTTRFGETHVLVTGKAGAPPLVLLHGALSSSAHVVREMSSLLERFQVYAVDVIGQSAKSADARIPLDGPQYAEWLVEVLDALGLERPHVYGVSWGGFVAGKLAAHAPHRIDRLVLLVPAGIVTGPAWKGFVKIYWPMMIYRKFPSRARLEKFARELLTTVNDEWLDYFGEAFQAYKLDMRVPPLFQPADLAGFDRPTLVFGASDDLSFPGGPLVERVRQLIPHAETELLEGVRHGPPTDDAFRRRQAERVARFLSGEVKAVKATGASASAS
jgi:2-hydroxy-6-oxonona-2,4-dienedioate hydrolase